jgi:branched-chain amino acid transport system permease protein
LIIGLNLSCFYLLIALGLTLMFGICGIVNMAHGAFYMAGAFGAFYLSVGAGINFFWSLAIVMVGIGLIGILLERGIFRTIEWEFAPTIVVTIGFSMLLEGLGYYFVGTRPRGLSLPVTGRVQLYGINLNIYRLVIFPITIFLAGGLYYFIQKTRFGLAMRATEEDRVAAALQGINANQVNTYVFFFGFALVAAAGSLMAPVYALTPSMGTMPLVKTFMVIVLGGMGSIPGAIVGSLIIGVLDAFLSFTVGTEFCYIVTWLIVIGILIFKPKGLFGAY